MGLVVQGSHLDRQILNTTRLKQRLTQTGNAGVMMSSHPRQSLQDLDETRMHRLYLSGLMLQAGDGELPAQEATLQRLWLLSEDCAPLAAGDGRAPALEAEALALHSALVTGGLPGPVARANLRQVCLPALMRIN